jgi:hypothetical protein
MKSSIGVPQPSITGQAANRVGLDPAMSEPDRNVRERRSPHISMPIEFSAVCLNQLAPMLEVCLHTYMSRRSRVFIGTGIALIRTHGSCRISVFVFVCARAFAEDLSSEIHRAPALAPHAITSLHGATSSMGPPLFDRGTEADSSSDGNRTLVGLFDARHAPVARHFHLGQVVDLFVQ